MFGEVIWFSWVGRLVYERLEYLEHSIYDVSDRDCIIWDTFEFFF